MSFEKRELNEELLVDVGEPVEEGLVYFKKGKNGEIIFMKDKVTVPRVITVSNLVRTTCSKQCAVIDIVNSLFVWAENDFPSLIETVVRKIMDSEKQAFNKPEDGATLATLYYSQTFIIDWMQKEKRNIRKKIEEAEQKLSELESVLTFAKSGQERKKIESSIKKIKNKIESLNRLLAGLKVTKSKAKKNAEESGIVCTAQTLDNLVANVVYYLSYLYRKALRTYKVLAKRVSGEETKRWYKGTSMWMNKVMREIKKYVVKLNKEKDRLRTFSQEGNLDEKFKGTGDELKEISKLIAEAQEKLVPIISELKKKLQELATGESLQIDNIKALFKDNTKKIKGIFEVAREGVAAVFNKDNRIGILTKEELTTVVIIVMLSIYYKLMRSEDMIEYYKVLNKYLNVVFKSGGAALSMFIVGLFMLFYISGVVFLSCGAAIAPLVLLSAALLTEWSYIVGFEKVARLQGLAGREDITGIAKLQRG